MASFLNSNFYVALEAQGVSYVVHLVKLRRTKIFRRNFKISQIVKGGKSLLILCSLLFYVPFLFNSFQDFFTYENHSTILLFLCFLEVELHSPGSFLKNLLFFPTISFLNRVEK